MNREISCRGYSLTDEPCEFCSAWFCKNPDCKTPVLTSTLYGARPSGCPIMDKWNSKQESEMNEKEQV